MKRCAAILILITLASGSVWAETSDFCEREKQNEWVRVNAEFLLADQPVCANEDRPSLTCPGVATDSPDKNHTPIDFIYSFLINPFFTSSFLAPEECSTPKKS